MKVIKHKGEGQTYCVGCLAAGRQPIHWDSSIIEVQYDDGNKMGCFCYECFKSVKKYLGLKEESKPYVSRSTASGDVYTCPNCKKETLTTGKTFSCEHCGYEVEL